jgi:hypothetical protein
MSDEPVVLFPCTRAQAIAGGVLIDVTDMAKEAGCRIPVALTHAVWQQYVAVPDVSRGRTRAGGCGTSCSCSTWPSEGRGIGVSSGIACT